VQRGKTAEEIDKLEEELLAEEDVAQTPLQSHRVQGKEQRSGAGEESTRKAHAARAAAAVGKGTHFKSDTGDWFYHGEDDHTKGPFKIKQIWLQSGHCH
jgi:hypothetical protein